MNILMKFSDYLRLFDSNRPQLMYGHISSQRWEPIITAAAIAAGGTIAGGIIGASGGGTKTFSTFSRDQKQLSRLLYDYLMGIKRNAKGKEISRDPMLSRAQRQPYPQRRTAPLTGGQKELLGQARDLIPSAVNRRRPDAAMGRALRGQVFDRLNRRQGANIPSQFGSKPTGIRRLKYGGVADTPFIAGEDGPEIIIPSGPTTVIPNPQTVSSGGAMANALRKSELLQRQTGLPGFVVGTSARQYGEQFVPYDVPEWQGTYFGESFLPGFTDIQRTDLQSGFETDFLASNYADEQWYQRFAAPTGERFGDVGQFGGLGGDISGAKREVKNRGGLKFTGSPYAPGNIHIGYEQAIADYWKTLPEVTENTRLNEILATIPQEEQAGFSEFYAGSPYDDPNRPLGYHGGELGFEDPFATDIGNLERARDEYMASRGYDFTDPATAPGAFSFSQDASGQFSVPAGYQQYFTPDETGATEGTLNFPDGESFTIPTFKREDGSVDTNAFAAFRDTQIPQIEAAADKAFGPSGFTKPEPPAPADPADFGPLLEQIDTNDYDAFNEYLKTYQGGVLADQGIFYDASLGEFGDYALRAPDEFLPGMSGAVRDFLAAKEAGTLPAPDADITPDVDDDDIDIAKIPTTTLAELAPLISQLAKKEFDPAKFKQEFKEGVADPAIERLVRQILPSLKEGLAGGDLFGSQREKLVLKAGADLQSSLASQQARDLRAQREGFESRQQRAIDQFMEFALLPGKIEGQIASNEYKTMASDALFANIINDQVRLDMELALVDSKITTETISGIVYLFSMFQAEQLFNQEGFDREFLDAMGAPDALPAILNLIHTSLARQEKAIGIS